MIGIATGGTPAGVEPMTIAWIVLGVMAAAPIVLGLLRAGLGAGAGADLIFVGVRLVPLWALAAAALLCAPVVV